LDLLLEPQAKKKHPPSQAVRMQETLTNDYWYHERTHP